MTAEEREVAWLKETDHLEEDYLVSVGGWVAELERQDAGRRPTTPAQASAPAERPLPMAAAPIMKPGA